MMAPAVTRLPTASHVPTAPGMPRFRANGPLLRGRRDSGRRAGCALTSPSASPRSPTISSAMPTCANRNVRHRQNFTITKIRADRSSRWYLPRAISLTRASSRPSAIARNMSRAARANRLNIRRRPNARIAKQTPRHNQRRNRPSARVSRSIPPSVAEKHLFAPFIVTNRLRSAGQIVY